MKRHCLSFFLLLISLNSPAETGYELWLRYRPVENKTLCLQYKSLFTKIYLQQSNPTATAIRNELSMASEGMLAAVPNFTSSINDAGLIILNRNENPAHTGSIDSLLKQGGVNRQTLPGDESFSIHSVNSRDKAIIIIQSNSAVGNLYGVFHLLRLMQTRQDLKNIHFTSIPKLKLRMLNHWDNLDRHVERGYSGISIWDWHRLPGYIDQRYIDYARANASIGINAVSLTNVNANATILTKPYLEKVKALADVLRPYGIKVYLTARFSAPIEIGNVSSADPLLDSVRNWWKEKAKEIYSLIPDFGGFLVKANSEGQPGPQDYKRTHADGANMLADAVAPHKGIVIWRAFVYAAENPVDRHKQAYDDFVPLDGKFRTNVMVQVKNGAIDFMPREPFHPLFGAMPKTPLMMEFQVTQEYLGQATNWVYLAPLYKEVLESDTYANGKNSTVARVLDGSLYNHALTGMTGVANIGNDLNWCGHHMAQANWYCLGRLAWDHQLTSEEIADEWLRMTFNNDPAFLSSMKKVMLDSREIMVNYTNPLGLHHLMGTGHHYGPAPWVSDLSRPEWNPVYYHRADEKGIGFDRTASGSNALEQYFPEARKLWEDINTCDEKVLLWFHHASWDHKMKNGLILWEELCRKFQVGIDSVKWMKAEWVKQKNRIDARRFNEVSMLLDIQLEEANWWRNACMLYFQTFSKKPIVSGTPPDKPLSYYQQLRFPFAPGR